MPMPTPELPSPPLVCSPELHWSVSINNVFANQLLHAVIGYWAENANQQNNPCPVQSEQKTTENYTSAKR